METIEHSNDGQQLAHYRSRPYLADVYSAAIQSRQVAFQKHYHPIVSLTSATAPKLAFKNGS
jgi:hypothetical protein